MVLTGRVVRFDAVRGFGFIAPEGGGQPDVFLHVNGLVDGPTTALETGTRVAFEMVEGHRGFKAYDVKVIGDDEALPSAPAKAQGQVPDLPETDMCDVLTRAELTAELTELLLTKVPTLTGAQVVEARAALLALAKSHDWVVD